MTITILKVSAVAIGAIAGIITIVLWLRSMKKGKERNIQLVFLDNNKRPCKHARVRITGFSTDLSTTADGDTNFTVGKKVRFITGIIYHNIPFEFNVAINETNDHYLVSVI